MNLVNLGYLIVVLLATGIVGFIGCKVKPTIGIMGAVIVLVIGYVAYTSYFENMMAKRWGGVLNVQTPAGELHILSTWKDDNLWLETYLPDENICIFREWSKMGVLEGEVRIKNCNPVHKGVALCPQI